MENIETLTDAELEMATAPEPEPAKTRNGRANADTDKRDAKTADKPKRLFIPFEAVIYSKPDRDVKTERKNRKTGAVIPGNTSTLMAELAIPMHGGVCQLKGTIWKEEKFDRGVGQFVVSYSVSLLNRFDFTITDGNKAVWDTWREKVLDGFDAWRKSDAYKVVAKTDRSMAPRLVETRTPTAEELIALNRV